VSGQQQALAALYPRERPGTHFTAGWVGPTAGLDGRKISSPPGFDPEPSSHSQSLYRPSYPAHYGYIQSGAKRTHVSEMGSSRESFFLWGYLKSKVYVRKPRTIDDLKVSIREEIANVTQEMLVNVMQNFEERLRTCVRQEGRHLSDIIFRN